MRDHVVRRWVVAALGAGVASAWGLGGHVSSSMIRTPGGAPIIVATRTAQAVVPLDAVSFLRPVTDRVGRSGGPCLLGGNLIVETEAGPRSVAFFDPGCRPGTVTARPAVLTRPRTLQGPRPL